MELNNINLKKLRILKSLILLKEEVEEISQQSKGLDGENRN